MQNAMYESVPIESIPDFGMYLDAPEEFIFEWYFSRFKSMHEESAGLAEKQRIITGGQNSLRSKAQQIWEGINRVNLEGYILPSARNADLVVSKYRDHSISEIRLKSPM